MTLLTTEQAVTAINKVIDRNEKVIAKFKSELDEGPAHAFHWAEAAMLAAALLQVYKGALRTLTATDTKATVRTLAEYYTREVLRSARNAGSSSSQTANIMRANELAAMACITELLTDTF